MKDLSNLEFNGKDRKILFRGSCLELLSLCEAICCREWDVPVSSAECESKSYEVDKICLLTEKECEKKIDTCINLKCLLKRKEDKSCVYLDDYNKCTIYEDRPSVCRNFSCQGGWRLASAFPVDDKSKNSETKMEKKDFIERLKDDMTFVLHPLLKIHAIFFLREKGEILFIKEMVGKCGKFCSRESYNNLKLNDDHLLGLISLFGRKDTLIDTYKRFCSQFDISLEKSEFHEIVWLLNKHRIILDSRNFPGMLSGMGGI